MPLFPASGSSACSERSYVTSFVPLIWLTSSTRTSAASQESIFMSYSVALYITGVSLMSYDGMANVILLVYHPFSLSYVYLSSTTFPSSSSTSLHKASSSSSVSHSTSPVCGSVFTSPVCGSVTFFSTLTCLILYPVSALIGEIGI